MPNLKRLRTWLVLAAVLLGAVSAAAAWFRFGVRPPPSPPDGDAHCLAGPPLFQDVTQAAGVDFTYRNGEEIDHYAILETLGGGVALLDYDGDGLLDVFLTGGGYF